MSTEQLEFSAAMIAGGLATSHHGLSAGEIAGKAISIARAIHEQLAPEPIADASVESRAIADGAVAQQSIADGAVAGEPEPDAPRRPSSIVPD